MILPRSIRLDKNREVIADPRNNPRLWERYGYVWEKGTFTVPLNTPEERVQFAAHKYVNKFGRMLEERKVFQVLQVQGPFRDYGAVAQAIVEPDRKRYVMWAKVRRRPVTTHFDIPDQYVPAMQAAGLKLQE